MFEWLVEEMRKVKTRKFYLVDGPLAADKRELLEQAELAVPPSYKTFLFQFGNAKLYRIGDQYRVEVFASPNVEETEDDEARVCFGRTEDTVAYFKESLLVPGRESPVFEWYYPERVERQTANDFEDWLQTNCARVRRYYTKKEWRKIETGPVPFSDQENMIVEARRNFRWRVVGISSNGDIQFEVHNKSDIVLPYLSVGIRGKRRGTSSILEGGVWLPVGSLHPGKTAMIEMDCYKEWVDPQDVVPFEEPDPEPKDRDRYWEFKCLAKEKPGHS
jgi:hypothetical protein